MSLTLDVLSRALLGAAAFCFILFCITYTVHPARLRNGFLFDAFLIAALGGLLCWMVSVQQKIISTLAVALAIVLFLLVLCGVFILFFYLFTSSVQMLKREQHSLPNMLSLILTVGIIAQIVIGIAFGWNIYKKPVVSLIFSYVFVGEFFLLLTMTAFLTMLILLHLHRPHYKKVRYLIVLGCGLLHGSDVSPMLAGRIDKAIHFYQRARKRGQHPTILLSGGQGGDEALPEGTAMYRYALAKGIPAEDLLAETNSKNTEENLRFSKEIIDVKETPKGAAKTRCMVVTNNYHLYRAIYYARLAGFRKIQGLGAKTAKYYFPNAVLREYLAVMYINRRFQIAFASILALLQTAIVVVSFSH
ncbi:MAG: YdcF family protein [Oscillospiraceae bacterium]|jgi:uncharacterized SAM-binding protein YcdF (DUF218 family)|nr:YdcF family protein [Oscillospiraceae bacterium]